MEILKAVIEQQRVGLKFLDRILAGFDAILVHQHDDVLEIGREHVRLVAGLVRIEQQRFAVADDARRREPLHAGEFDEQAFQQRALGALVAAREDGDAPAALGQGTGEFFHDGRLAGAADGEVADAHHQAAERPVAQQSHPVAPEPQLDREGKELRERRQERAQKVGAFAAAALEDDVEDKGFQVLGPILKKLRKSHGTGRDSAARSTRGQGRSEGNGGMECWSSGAVE